MGSEEEARASESAQRAHGQGGRSPASWVVRAASALAGTAVTVGMEIATALRLASLATGLVVRVSADLVTARRLLRRMSAGGFPVPRPRPGSIAASRRRLWLW
jgi:protein-disulfide isomerase-like protein with CxxC motif